MSGTVEFWADGVCVGAEHADRQGLYITRYGWGVGIRQNRGTSNWFHFAIPSAAEPDGDNADYRRVWQRVRANGDAAIGKVQVREASADGFVIYDSGAINLTGLDAVLSINLPDSGSGRPLHMCLFVEFQGETGEVVFGTVRSGRR